MAEDTNFDDLDLDDIIGLCNEGGSHNDVFNGGIFDDDMNEMWTDLSAKIESDIQWNSVCPNQVSPIMTSTSLSPQVPQRTQSGLATLLQSQELDAKPGSTGTFDQRSALQQALAEPSHSIPLAAPRPTAVLSQPLPQQPLISNTPQTGRVTGPSLASASDDTKVDDMLQFLQELMQHQNMKHQQQLQQLQQQQRQVPPQLRALVQRALSLQRQRSRENQAQKAEEGAKSQYLSQLLDQTPQKPRTVHVAVASPPPASLAPKPVVTRPAASVPPTVIALTGSPTSQKNLSGVKTAAPVTLVASSAGQTLLTPGIQLPIQVIEGDKVALTRLPGTFTEKPEKKNSHNAVEKRYRSSINDRVIHLKNLVAGPDAKLTKSSVLQKAIEYILHLKRDNARLRQDKDILKKALEAQGITVEDRSVPMEEQPTPPPSDVSSEGEQSPRSSPDAPLFTDDFSSAGAPDGSGMSHLLLPAVLFGILLFNPLALLLGGANSFGSDFSSEHTGGRTLLEFKDAGLNWKSVIVWLFNFLVVTVIFFKLMIGSEPITEPDSVAAAKYNRHKTQADLDLSLRNVRGARVQLAESLRWLGRYVPAPGGLGMHCSLLWQLLRHVLQLPRLSRWLAARRLFSTEKTCVMQASASDAAVAFHRLSELQLVSESEGALYGLTLSLKALNLGELACPLLQPAQLAQMYGTAALHILHAQSGWTDIVARYWLRRCTTLLWEQGSGLPPAVDWLTSPEGRRFLLQRKWTFKSTHDSCFSELDDPTSPLAVVRCQFREQLLERCLVQLVSPGYLEDSECSPRPVEHAQRLLQQADMLLDACRPHEHLETSSYKRTVRLMHSDGDEVCAWWASLLKASIAEQASLSKDTQGAEEIAILPSALALREDPLVRCVRDSFLARRISRSGPETACNFSVLSACNRASVQLQQTVGDPAQPGSGQAATLAGAAQRRLACQTLAAEWLLGARTEVWERQQAEGSGVVTSHSQLRAFQQDLTVLRQLAQAWPAAMPKVLVYEAVGRIMAGARPGRIQQLLLDKTLRRRTVQSEAEPSELEEDTSERGEPRRASSAEAVFGEKERALALLLAAKHLPSKLLAEMPGSKQALLSECHAAYKRLGDEKGLQACQLATKA